jgi:hypothetical protein
VRDPALARARALLETQIGSNWALRTPGGGRWGTGKAAPVEGRRQVARDGVEPPLQRLPAQFLTQFGTAEGWSEPRGRWRSSTPTTVPNAAAPTTQPTPGLATPTPKTTYTDYGRGPEASQHPPEPEAPAHSRRTIRRFGATASGLLGHPSPLLESPRHRGLRAARSG